MKKSILLIQRLHVHNANALSSPYTIGFPAMTAWLGAVHALERKLKLEERFDDEFEELKFKSAAVVCHDIRLHTHRGKRDFVSSIIGTGNPLDKTGKRSSFIEEARCDLTVSLLIEYEAPDGDEELEESVDNLLKSHMKIAGGDILKTSPSKRKQINNEYDVKALMGLVMPGHCLIERRDLMKQSMEDGQDAIDSLLGYLKITHHCEEDSDGKISWSSSRKSKGWLVPVATGFHGISEIGKAEQQRDQETPHRFAESLVTLGEFVMPYRITDLDNMLWHYHHEAENNLYLCQPNKPVTENKETTHA